jgi:thiamine pyrophosphokinase
MGNIEYSKTIILANGSFPCHEIPVAFLKNASRVICCDGAARPLIEFGLDPFAIVGDCDSLDKEILKKYKDRIFRDPEQETNDLTKAVKWCSEKGFMDITIVGATGKREDHTLGNISLLIEYALTVDVYMVTDYGIFYPVFKSCSFKSSPGQQVSFFSISPETEITSSGLLYPLKKRKLKNWWEATLNETTGDSFSLEFESGQVLVFLKFME